MFHTMVIYFVLINLVQINEVELQGVEKISGDIYRVLKHQNDHQYLSNINILTRRKIYLEQLLVDSIKIIQGDIIIVNDITEVTYLLSKMERSSDKLTHEVIDSLLTKEAFLSHLYPYGESPVTDSAFDGSDGYYKCIFPEHEVILFKVDNRFFEDFVKYMSTKNGLSLINVSSENKYVMVGIVPNPGSGYQKFFPREYLFKSSYQREIK